MHEAGGHGGSTLAERLVPLVTIGDIGRSNFQPPATPATPTTPRLADSGAVPQIDLVPTLSILLGQPIPAQSKGKLIPSWLRHLPIDVQLHAHLYNAARLASMLEEDISHGWYSQFIISRVKLGTLKYIHLKNISNLCLCIVFEMLCNQSWTKYISSTKYF